MNSDYCIADSLPQSILEAFREHYAHMTDGNPHEITVGHDGELRFPSYKHEGALRGLSEGAVR